MGRKSHRFSIFSQSLDRAALLAYLLGAIVPLLALAWVIQAHVLPTLEGGRTIAGLLGLVFSTTALSFASFLALRVAAHRGLARMDQDNRLLSGLLSSARALSQTPHQADAAQTLADSASELASAEAVLVLTLEKDARDPAWNAIAHAGPGSAAAYVSQQTAMDELASLALDAEGPVIQSGAGHEAAKGPGLVAIPLLAEDRTRRVLVLLRRNPPQGSDEAVLDALSTLCGLGAVALRNSDLCDMQLNFFVHLTDMLVSALDYHLGYHEGHGRRVAHISNEIGRELGLGDDRRERLHFAALLHDIGMLKIPPRRHDDHAALRKHPILGHRMLSSIRMWEDLGPFVLHHHERYDGSGYPEGLAGEEIPLEARIIGLAEAVDSMVCGTAHAESRSPEYVLAEVEQGSGTQFDPGLAEILLDLVRRGSLELG